MKITRRNLLGAAGAAALSAGPATLVLAQDHWPSKPIRLVAPYAPGGPSDISARVLAEHLGKSLGQQVIVENKPGAGTRLANELVARTAPDGYTLLYAAAPYATAEALYGKQKFDVKTDLLPVTFVAMAPLFLIVNADSGVRNVRELVALGKSRSAGLNFGSPGAGSQPNLAADLFLKDAKLKGEIIHFRGDAPAYVELLGGRIDATLTAITTALPHIRAGKLRVLGVASAERSPLFPDAPTLREQCMGNVVASGWYGMMVPGKTPRLVVARLQAEINRALSDPEVRQKFLSQGLEPRGGTPAEFQAFMDNETRKWTAVIRQSGIKGE
jgi:tripartite-type tricarboxylate transporter receptor subunit TctC